MPWRQLFSHHRKGIKRRLPPARNARFGAHCEGPSSTHHDPIDREVLRGLGVDYAQGYGVSQPQRVQRAAIA